MAAPPLILDASVAAKWILPEKDSPLALDFRELYLKGEVQFVVPSLFYFEIANALKFKRGVTAEEAQDFVDALFQYGLDTQEASAELLRDAAVAARALHAQVTVYDACYLVLAQRRSGVMLTTDAKFERLAVSRHVASLAKAHAEWVR